MRSPSVCDIALQTHLAAGEEAVYVRHVLACAPTAQVMAAQNTKAGCRAKILALYNRIDRGSSIHTLHVWTIISPSLSHIAPVCFPVQNST